MASTREAWKQHESLIAVVDCDDVSRAIESGATDIIVDLRTARSVGTRVINTLLEARCSLLARGGQIAVVLPPRLRRLFGLLNLDSRFVLAADRRQALERLGLVDDFSDSARAA